jgi:hypothetical protein
MVRGSVGATGGPGTGHDLRAERDCWTGFDLPHEPWDRGRNGRSGMGVRSMEPGAGDRFDAGVVCLASRFAIGPRHARLGHFGRPAHRSTGFGDGAAPPIEAQGGDGLLE